MKLFNFFFFLTLLSCSNAMKNNPVKTIDIYEGHYRELMDKANEQQLEGIETIVKENNLNLNYSDTKYGVSLLNWCIFNDKMRSFQKLLELGADPNWQDTRSQFAPVIIEASQVSHTAEYLSLSLKYHGNPNKLSKGILGSRNQTPLLAAVSSRRIENVNMLIENGADINFNPSKSQNWFPLTEALVQDDIEIVKVLLLHGADYKLVQFKTERGEILTIDYFLNEMNFSSNPSKNKVKKEVEEVLKELKAKK